MTASDFGSLPESNSVCRNKTLNLKLQSLTRFKPPARAISLGFYNSSRLYCPPRPPIPPRHRDKWKGAVSLTQNKPAWSCWGSNSCRLFNNQEGVHSFLKRDADRRSTSQPRHVLTLSSSAEFNVVLSFADKTLNFFTVIEQYDSLEPH